MCLYTFYCKKKFTKEEPGGQPGSYILMLHFAVFYALFDNVVSALMHVSLVEVYV